MSGIRRHNAGFSLVELLIAMTIFVFVATMSVVVFAQIIRSQKFISSRQALQEDSRFLVEKIVKEFKNGTIDYAQYHADHWSTTYNEYQALPADENHPNSINDGQQIAGSTRNYETTLNIINPEGTQQTKMRLNATTNTVDVQKLSSCITPAGDVEWNPLPEYVDGDDDFLPLSPETISITALDFYIYPLKDPNKVYDDDSVQYQPTLVLRLTAETKDAANPATLDLQTSVTSRLYDEARWDETTIPDC